MPRRNRFLHPSLWLPSTLYLPLLLPTLHVISSPPLITGKSLQEIHRFLALEIPQEMHAYFRGKMFCKIYLSLKANMHRERDSFLTGKILQEIHRFLGLEIPQEMHASLKGKMRCETCAFLKVKSH